MQPFFEDYLQRLSDLHADAMRAIDGLPTEALDWMPLDQPAEDMNSINILVTHFCGAERYWIGDIALGEPSERVRSEEFQVAKLDVLELADRIESATAYARQALARLSLDELALERTQLRDGRPVSAGWALLHALEHTAIHVGHIQITRQLWVQGESRV
jgi:uncharacterized damage-inducible protein DinB